MKYAIALAAFLSFFSTSSFAGEKYVCGQYETHNYTMILKQVGDDKMVENRFYPFTLEIFDEVEQETAFLTTVNVRIEDVMVKISNTAKKISGIIYLDESEFYLKMGSETLHFECD